MIPKGSEKLRRVRKEAFKNMTPKEKLQYIFEYYKLPLFTAFVVLVVLISGIVRAVTKKDTLLYLAYTNVSFGETLDGILTNDYLEYRDIDSKQYEILVYRDLYIDEDPSSEYHQYVYGSKMKILGAVSASQMDLVIMNDNAWQQLSESGLLLNLDFLEAENAELYNQISSHLRTNTVIIDDNSIEYNLNEADTYEAVTEQQANAIEVTDLPAFNEAGIDGSLYIGMIANTKRRDEAMQYIGYLFR